jgi:hypothetical protein
MWMSTKFYGQCNFALASKGLLSIVPNTIACSTRLIEAIKQCHSTRPINFSPYTLDRLAEKCDAAIRQGLRLVKDLARDALQRTRVLQQAC